jgi:hypothetical protein
MVYLRLGMMVGGITGPLPRHADNFPNNQVRLGTVRIVKDGSDDPGRSFPHGSFSPEFAAAFFGTVKFYLKRLGIIGGTVAKLSALFPRSNDDPPIYRNGKAPGGIIKKIGPGNILGPIGPQVYYRVSLG